VPTEADRLITDSDARISSSARRTILQQGRIHLRRLNFAQSFLLQARGGPYIIVNYRHVRSIKQIKTHGRAALRSAST